jgi:hypothetical protein
MSDTLPYWEIQTLQVLLDNGNVSPIKDGEKIIGFILPEYDIREDKDEESNEILSDFADDLDKLDRIAVEIFAKHANSDLPDDIIRQVKEFLYEEIQFVVLQLIRELEDARPTAQKLAIAERKFEGLSKNIYKTGWSDCMAFLKEFVKKEEGLPGNDPGMVLGEDKSSKVDPFEMPTKPVFGQDWEPIFVADKVLNDNDFEVVVHLREQNSRKNKTLCINSEYPHIGKSGQPVAPDEVDVDLGRNKIEISYVIWLSDRPFGSLNWGSPRKHKYTKTFHIDENGELDVSKKAMWQKENQ